MEKTKRVSILCLVPVHGIINARPLTGYIRSIELTIEQIRKCIVQKASVKELLPDGRVKLLDLSNYDKFEEIAVPEEPVQVTVEPKIETTVEETVIEEEIIEEPVVEETVEEATIEEPVIEEVVEETVEEIIEETTEEPVEESVEERPFNKKKHRR